MLNKNALKKIIVFVFMRTNIDSLEKIRARIELLLPNPLQYALACLLVGNKSTRNNIDSLELVYRNYV